MQTNSTQIPSDYLGKIKITKYPIFVDKSTKSPQHSSCMHDNCPTCKGTGIRNDGLGSCVHMISCPCKKCTPW